MATFNDTLRPSDATSVGDWMLDHDGYGRPFRGTVHGAVSISGYQHADGRVERTFHVTGGGELTLMGTYSLMGDLNAAADEVETLNEHS